MLFIKKNDECQVSNEENEKNSLNYLRGKLLIESFLSKNNLKKIDNEK